MTICPLTAPSGADAPGGALRFTAAFVILAILSLGSAAALANEQAPSDAQECFFSQTFGDLPEEIKVARDGGKLGMLLFFEAEFCPYCQRMIRDVFSQKNVQEWFGQRFVCIAVDVNGDVELTDFDGITLPSKVFSDHRRIFATPIISFIDLDGNEIYRHLGMIETSEELLMLGEYIEGNYHYSMEFKTYARQRGAEDKGDVLVTPAGASE